MITEMPGCVHSRWRVLEAQKKAHPVFRMGLLFKSDGLACYGQPTGMLHNFQFAASIAKSTNVTLQSPLKSPASTFTQVGGRVVKFHTRPSTYVGAADQKVSTLQ